MTPNGPSKGVGESRDVALDIALAEYEHLRTSRQVSFQGSGSRFNFYLIVVAASPAGLTLAANAAPDATIWFSGALLLSVFALGLITFRRLVEFDYWSMYYTRGLNHIRAYFLKRAEELREFFVLPSEIDYPPFLDPHGLVVLTGLINSVVLGLIVGGGTGTLAGDNIAIGLIVGLITLGSSWLTHVGYVLFKRERFQIRYQEELPQDVRPRGTAPDASLSPKSFSERRARRIALFLRKRATVDS